MSEKENKLLTKLQAKVDILRQENLMLKAMWFDKEYPNLKDIEGQEFKSAFVDSMMKLQRQIRDTERLKALFEDTKKELIELRVEFAKVKGASV